ncbi:unnamed protein product [Linum trigynum]|uniref:Uncharacterized protein n=1 Tax=Linum trigynum TaxID=586398 RepID=A0AAV2CA88_9ROSI
MTRPFCLAVDVLTPTGLFATNYGAYWRQMRHICTAEMLSTRAGAVAELGEGAVAWEMVDSISSSAKKTNPVNLSEMIFARDEQYDVARGVRHEVRGQRGVRQVAEEGGGSERRVRAAGLVSDVEVLEVEGSELG